MWNSSTLGMIWSLMPLVEQSPLPNKFGGRYYDLAPLKNYYYYLFIYSWPVKITYTHTHTHTHTHKIAVN